MSKLSWSHFLQAISLDNDLQRNFYLTMAADQRWSTRTLKAKIDGMLFERTALIIRNHDGTVARARREAAHDLATLPNRLYRRPAMVINPPIHPSHK